MVAEQCRSNHLTLSGVIVAVLLSVGSALAGTSEHCRVAYHRQDYAEALRLCQPLAEQDEPVAQTTLGSIYERGQGVVRDDAEAVRWYRKAAEQGLAYALDRLAVMYRQGRGGLPQDYAEAARWVRKSAEQGEAIAQAYLGTLHLQGLGVAHDYAEAASWFRKAANQGDAPAQWWLGRMYEAGCEVVPQGGRSGLRGRSVAATAGAGVEANEVNRFTVRTRPRRRAGLHNGPRVAQLGGRTGQQRRRECARRTF
jgi:hypothetical protein